VADLRDAWTKVAARPRSALEASRGAAYADVLVVRAVLDAEARRRAIHEARLAPRARELVEPDRAHAVRDGGAEAHAAGVAHLATRHEGVRVVEAVRAHRPPDPTVADLEAPNAPIADDPD